MMPGSKGLSPHELAHKWVKDLGTRPDMRMAERIVRVLSTEQSVGIKAMYTTSANIAFPVSECKKKPEYFARI